MTLQIALDKAIKKVCPIYGISFKDVNDKTTWRIDFMPEASEEQRAAAQKVLQDFKWDAKDQEEAEDDSMLGKYTSDPLAQYAFSLYLKDNPGANFAEFVKYIGSLVAK